MTFPFARSQSEGSGRGVPEPGTLWRRRAGGAGRSDRAAPKRLEAATSAARERGPRAGTQGPAPEDARGSAVAGRRSPTRLLPLAAGAAGAAAGYLLERALLRPRLHVSRSSPQLGELDGATEVLRGPDGVRLFTETYGPAAEDAAGEMVLVHGFVMSGRCWHEQVVALRDRFRLVTYDQPGHARSSGPRSGEYDLDLLADCLATVVREATGRGRLVLAGHSMGGMTILAFARRHPRLFADRVKGVLLLSTTSSSGAEDLALGVGIQLFVRLQQGIEAVAGLLGERAQHLARVYRASSDLSHLLTKYYGLAGAADARHVDLTEQLVLDTDPQTALALTPTLLAMDEDETLAGLDVPTIVLVGSADTITPAGHAHRMARVNPDVELVELPGIGHMTPLEAHPTVTALALWLLAAGDPRRPAAATAPDAPPRSRPEA